ncbi:MAG: hypothetical protein KGS61_05315 [Verrucomicrobia bacterium]|nr:hypothetical protein [Verrucomicrobiota bacterium]
MKTARLHSCNVLELAGPYAQLWQFSVGNGEVKLQAERQGSTTEPLPPRLAVKTWRTLWQRKLNLAWLPADQVFLRVAHLPTSEPAEILPMVELQLEKLSPLPVAQIVWSVERVPLRAGAEGALQTVIVVIVARDLVESMLGQLEGQGYLPDRLELPQVHQLLTTTVEEDGVWLYPDPGPERKYCLAAWWAAGMLQYVSLLHLPAADAWSEALVRQLTETAWAGEFEGWFDPPVPVHVVAGPEAGAAWEAALQPWRDGAIKLTAALSRVDLAALSARRAARAESAANLLPVEYTNRYHQQFVDRLWMRGLFAVLGLYSVAVLVYFAALQVVSFQDYQVDNKVAALKANYTEALKLKARMQVLLEQVNLKFAALDCWKAVAELMPPDLTLENMAFQHGKLTLYGTVPADQYNELNDYNDSLGKASVNGVRLFGKVSAPSSQTAQGGERWSFTCDIKRMEAE